MALSRPIKTHKLHKVYSKIDVFISEPVNYVTPHPKRQDTQQCIFCLQQTSPDADWFRRNTKKIDRLVQCGHVSNGQQCGFKLHMSCVSYCRPMPRFDAQYLSLPTNNGVLQCPNHVCETCFSDGYQQSAGRAELVQDDEYLRAFHRQCLPAGATWKVKEQTVTVKEQQTYSGTHIGICEVCGDCKKTLTKCSMCCNSYHYSCRGLDNVPARVKMCQSCCFDTQIRIGENVLVEKSGIFCAAKTVSSRKSGFVRIVFLSDKSSKIVAVNSIFRPRPDTAHTVFQSWKHLYGPRNAEKSNVSKLLEAAKEFRPNVVRPTPETHFSNSFILTPSVLEKLPKGYRNVPTKVIQMQKSNPNLKVVFDKNKGYCVVATSHIKSGDFIGIYIGEIISIGEREFRKKLGKHDKEAKYYWFQSSMECNTERKQVFCDGAKVQNITAILNHSCKANCKARNADMEIGHIEFEYQTITASRDIAEGEELTLNYQWENEFLGSCYCGFCPGPKKLDWN